MDAKCKCNICSESIAFPIELAGQTIECPHCTMETILFIPPGFESVTETQPEIWNDKSKPIAERVAGYKAHLTETKPKREADLAELKKQAPGVVDAKCPRCSSENTLKCAMAYQQGTTTGVFSGLGLDLDGDIGGFGGVKTSRTLLASSVAPPRKEGMNSGLLLLLIGVSFGGLICFGLISDDDTKPKWPWALVLFTCLGTFGYLCYALAKDNERRTAVHQERIRKYLRQWLCMRCGSIFEP